MGVERELSYRPDGMTPLLLILGIAAPAMAGFRCTLGEWACTSSCVVLGQTSGICDEGGECNCSEKSISLDNLKALLPSRCNLGEGFCSTTCNSIGRKNGTCVTLNKNTGEVDCQCDGFLSPKEFALCGATSTCRLDCQRQGFATGDCFGWSCKCQTNIEDQLPKELEEIKNTEESE